MRTTLALTQSVLSRPYVVNELLFPGDPVESGPRHPSELAGQDIQAHDDSFWRDFVQESKQKDGIEVSAGPILHTGGCQAREDREGDSVWSDHFWPRNSPLHWFRIHRTTSTRTDRPKSLYSSFAKERQRTSTSTTRCTKPALDHVKDFTRSPDCDFGGWNCSDATQARRSREAGGRPW